MVHSGWDDSDEHMAMPPARVCWSGLLEWLLLVPLPLLPHKSCRFSCGSLESRLWCGHWSGDLDQGDMGMLVDCATTAKVSGNCPSSLTYWQLYSPFSLKFNPYVPWSKVLILLAGGLTILSPLLITQSKYGSINTTPSCTNHIFVNLVSVYVLIRHDSHYHLHICHA